MRESVGSLRSARVVVVGSPWCLLEDEETGYYRGAVIEVGLGFLVVLFVSRARFWVMRYFEIRTFGVGESGIRALWWLPQQIVS